MTKGASTGQNLNGARRGDRQLLGVQIAEDLTRHIRREGLLDGDPLPSEAVLAEQYGVSQRVVRDALRFLSHQGLLRTQQGKRAVVSDPQPVAVHAYFKLLTAIDDRAIGDLLELRQALETKAAGLAATRIGAAEVTELEKLMADTSECGEDLDRRVSLDLAFHRAIVRVAQNRFIIAIHQALGEVLATERQHGANLAQFAQTQHEESDAEHRAIVYSLRSADPMLAEQAMRTHLEHVVRRFAHDTDLADRPPSR